MKQKDINFTHKNNYAILKDYNSYVRLQVFAVKNFLREIIKTNGAQTRILIVGKKGKNQGIIRYKSYLDKSYDLKEYSAVIFTNVGLKRQQDYAKVARTKGIPTIGFMSIASNPLLVDYAVVIPYTFFEFHLINDNTYD